MRREMLNIVRTTLDNVREMREVTEDKRLPKRDPKSKDPVARRIFRNANWELDLVFKPGKGARWVVSDESTIKNISTGGKTLPLVDLSTNQGLPFYVSQADGTGTATTWRITGEPVGPNATRPLSPAAQMVAPGRGAPIHGPISTRAAGAGLCTVHVSPARRSQASGVSMGRALRWPRSAGAPEPNVLSSPFLRHEVRPVHDTPCVRPGA